MNKFMDTLVSVSAKLSQNRILNIIQSAFMLMLPVYMIGGFAALFNGIGIDVYQAFIASAGIKTVLSVIYQWTIGMIALYLSFLVAYRHAQTYKYSQSDIARVNSHISCFSCIFNLFPDCYTIHHSRGTICSGQPACFLAGCQRYVQCYYYCVYCR